MLVHQSVDMPLMQQKGMPVGCQMLTIWGSGEMGANVGHFPGVTLAGLGAGSGCNAFASIAGEWCSLAKSAGTVKPCTICMNKAQFEYRGQEIRQSFIRALSTFIIQ